MVENQIRKKVKKLRIDNGLELCNQVFDNYCVVEGITRHKTVRLKRQQNGLVERMNRTLVDKERTMMIQAKLPMNLWAETLNTSYYLVNLSPSFTISFKTSHEMWFGNPASYGSLRVFSCQPYC